MVLTVWEYEMEVANSVSVSVRLSVSFVNAATQSCQILNFDDDFLDTISFSLSMPPHRV